MLLFNAPGRELRKMEESKLIIEQAKVYYPHVLKPCAWPNGKSRYAVALEIEDEKILEQFDMRKRGKKEDVRKRVFFNQPIAPIIVYDFPHEAVKLFQCAQYSNINPDMLFHEILAEDITIENDMVKRFYIRTINLEKNYYNLLTT